MLDLVRGAGAVILVALNELGEIRGLACTTDEAVLEKLAGGRALRREVSGMIMYE